LQDAKKIIERKINELNKNEFIIFWIFIVLKRMEVSWDNIAKFLAPYRRLHGIESDTSTNEEGWDIKEESANEEESANNKTNENYTNVVTNPRGRPRKYHSTEERKMAKNVQTINSHKRKHELLSNIKT
jgi:hypothetical protein